MRTRVLEPLVLSIIAGLTIALSGCGPIRMPSDPAGAVPATPSAPAASEELPPTVATSDTPEATETPQALEEYEPGAPEQVVERFYNWYVGYIRNVGDPLSGGAYRSSEYLAEALIQEVDGIIASREQDGPDPFLCAQDVPKGLTFDGFDAAAVSGDRASLVVRTSLEGHSFTVELQRMDGRWAISDVICAGADASASQAGEATTAPPEGTAEAEDPTASWQVFVDTEYGFQVRFPQGWTYEEIPPVPAKVEDPDSLRALKRVLTFEPRDWDGVTPPLNIEVIEGTEEEFGHIFGTPISTEHLEINGYVAVKAVDEVGQARLVRYIFQSPVQENANESPRVVIIDAISGFPERADGNQDVITVIQQILHTFEFTQ